VWSISDVPHPQGQLTEFAIPDTLNGQRKFGRDIDIKRAGRLREGTVICRCV
jgi:hypothetical protein